MNSLRYLASSLSYRSPPRPAAGDHRDDRGSRTGGRAGGRTGGSESSGNTGGSSEFGGSGNTGVGRRRSAARADSGAEDEKTVARARRPARKGDERRRPRKSKEGDAPVAGPVRLGFVWRLLGLLLPFLARESSTAQRKARTAERRKHRQTSSTALPPIPRMLLAAKRKTLVLDLDETLIHSMTRGSSSLGPSQMVEVHLKNSSVSSFYYVAKRPYCLDFLRAVMQWYDVAIFTASVKEYADPIIDLLERDLGIYQAFKRRYYRTDCIPDGSGSGGYIKDLTVLGEDLARVLLVDNSQISFVYQQANGIPVEGWISDPTLRL